ncbi:MAG: hypothetical protein IPJ85_17930 [Flavobacteriales bacterium]|nr:hypothetical protein [Flavobacteriales bacterium]
MPVELISFTVSPAEDGTALVQWATASENNSASFTVERASDPSSWTAVTTVDAVGNSQTLSQYEVTDHNPHYGISYYRLRQTDTDGTVTDYPIVTLWLEGDGSAPLIFPNPNQGAFTILFNEPATGTLWSRLADASGRSCRLRALATEGGSVWYSAPRDLQPGFYDRGWFSTRRSPRSVCVSRTEAIANLRRRH